MVIQQHNDLLAEQGLTTKASLCAALISNKNDVHEFACLLQLDNVADYACRERERERGNQGRRVPSPLLRAGWVLCQWIFM